MMQTQWHGLQDQAKNLWQRMVELVFPAFCLGCKKEGAFLCERCLNGIPLQEEQCCPICYQKKSGLVCDDCKRADLFLDGVITASPFEKNSLLLKSIHALKYEFLEDLAVPLGKLLARTLRSNESLEIVICPVPLHRKRHAWRGFNQSELLAKNLVGVRVQHLLQRLHYQKPQMELSRAERLKNVENVFSVLDGKDAVQGKTILLIDDVATTLSTLNNCAKALKKAGAEKVFGLVLARVY